MASSSPTLVAREKAREAVESVHTARDMRVITWAQINNTSVTGGRFAVGAQPLLQPGADGLVNTADDPTTLEEEITPGPDSILGTSDDVHVPLANLWRTIAITDISGEPSLRQLRVTIRYQVGTTTRTYVLTTYVSSFA